MGKIRFALLVAVLAVPPLGQATAANVVQLTQTGCQFLEPEGKDREFVTKTKADCVAVNQKTGTERLNGSEALHLKPGTHTFRVTNRDVPYELGFWLRTKGYDWRNPLHKLTKTSVSGGGLTEGKTQDYTMTLTPGEYLYSCPLNPTPDYRLVVDPE